MVLVNTWATAAASQCQRRDMSGRRNQHRIHALSLPKNVRRGAFPHPRLASLLLYLFCVTHDDSVAGNL
jgi:hypothetical protein